MDTVKVGMIGLGEFGLLELNVLSNLPNVEVIALVSRSADRARQLAERFKVENVFSTIDDLLANVKPDALVVATEDTRHYEPTMAALNAGVDVFLEKPISHDLNEARTMIDTAAHLNRKFMIGHILRFDTRCAAIKERIVSGEMGEIITVYGRRNLARSLASQYSHSNRLFTTGVHDIDLILWYYEGKKPVEVYMKSRDVFGDGDDVFWGIITMDDGSLGVVETTWLLPSATPWRGHILLEVIGTKSTALAEVPGNVLTFWSDTQVEIPDTSYWPSLHGTTVGTLRDEIAYFIRCVAEDKPINIPYPEDAYNTMRVATALVQSAQQGRPIFLE